MTRLDGQGLPIVEWIPLDLKGRRWGLQCRRCREVEEVACLPDGETGKNLLLDAYLKKHQVCAPRPKA